MKIRTIYFKVNDMSKAVKFWAEFLQAAPVKTFDKYYEWRIGSLNFGLVLNAMDDKWSGSNCVPVFEFEDAELMYWIERAKLLGATIVFDGLEDPELLSFVMADPWGNEFELSKFH